MSDTLFQFIDNYPFKVKIFLTSVNAQTWSFSVVPKTIKDYSLGASIVSVYQNPLTMSLVIAKLSNIYGLSWSHFHSDPLLQAFEESAFKLKIYFWIRVFPSDTSKSIFFTMNEGTTMFQSLFELDDFS